MTKRKGITCCCTTDHGGRVLQGYGLVSHQGHAVAGLGHLVFCPTCNGVFPIVQSVKSLAGYAPAVEGMRTACGARLISTCDDFWIEDDSGLAELNLPRDALGEATASAASAPPPADAADGVSSAAFEAARTADAVHIVIRMALCSDGTGNNFPNSQWTAENCSPKAAGLDKHPGVIDQLMATCLKDNKKRDTSYEGGETNVHRLYELYRITSDLDHADTDERGRHVVTLAIYIEGIGTRADHKDSLYGFAFGYGPTGVIARAEEAVKAATNEIGRFYALSPNIIIDAIEFDLFGFSRGSAASRHLASLITHAGNTGVMAQALRTGGLPLKAGWDGGNKSDLCIRFMGLYETVAAMGIPDNECNDPAKLYLADDDADNVAHVTARDECRENFALNRVTPSRYVDIGVPGVHSDVGGGYPKLGWEQSILTRPEVSLEPLNHDEYQRYVDAADRGGAPDVLDNYLYLIATKSRAWKRTMAQCSAASPPLNRDGLIDPQLNPPPNWDNCKIQHWCTVIGNPDLRQRGQGQSVVLQVMTALVCLRQVRGEYQLVTLRIMHALATQAGVPLKDIPNQPAYALPDELKPIGDKLVSYALNGGKGDCPLSDDEQQMLSRRYLHQSATWNPQSWTPQYEEQASSPTLAHLPNAQNASLVIFFPMRPADQRKRLTYKQKKGH